MTHDEARGKLTTRIPDPSRRAAMGAGLAAAVAVVAGLAATSAWAAPAKKKSGSQKTFPKAGTQRTERKTGSQRTSPKSGAQETQRKTGSQWALPKTGSR